MLVVDELTTSGQFDKVLKLPRLCLLKSKTTASAKYN